MSKARTWLANEAEFICGVHKLAQREWRRRGFLPECTEGWVRFDYAELGRLRLVRYFSERRIALSKAAQLAEHLAPYVGNSLAAALSTKAGGGPFAEWTAVLITRPGETEITELEVISDIGSLKGPLQLQHKDGGQTVFDFADVQLVNLAPIARELAAKIADLDERAGLLREIHEGLERVEKKLEAKHAALDALEGKAAPPKRTKTRTEPEPTR